MRGIILLQLTACAESYAATVARERGVHTLAADIVSAQQLAMRAPQSDGAAASARHDERARCRHT